MKGHSITVRIPPGMRDAIRESADRNHRSMNAEIVHHLQTVMDLRDDLGTYRTTVARYSEDRA